MLQYEAPRIQTNIGDPGQSIANAQRGFAQLGAVAQDIMTREANRTKEEEIAARYAEQVERDVANRKADIEYRDKVFETVQGEKEYARELGRKENIAATFIARGDTKGLNQFLKDNPDAATLNVAKMMQDAEMDRQRLALQRAQVEASKRSERPLSQEEKRMHVLTVLDPQGKQGLVERYIKSNWFGKPGDNESNAKLLDDVYKDIGKKENAAELSALVGKAINAGGNPREIARQYFASGPSFWNSDKVDTGALEEFVSKLSNPAKK